MNNYKKFLFLLGGTLVLVLGVTLILMWWDDVVTFFRGIIGMILGVGGLLVLYSLKK